MLPVQLDTARLKVLVVGRGGAAARKVATLDGAGARHVGVFSDAPGPVLRRRDVAALMAYDWPGNVRELQNVIDRAVILASSDRLHIELSAGGGPTRRGADGAGGAGDHPSVQADGGDRSADPARGFQTEVERLQRMRADIRAALEAAGGKLSGPGGAAALLGLRPSTLTSRMRSLGLERPRR